MLEPIESLFNTIFLKGEYIRRCVTRESQVLFISNGYQLFLPSVSGTTTALTGCWSSATRSAPARNLREEINHKRTFYEHLHAPFPNGGLERSVLRKGWRNTNGAKKKKNTHPLKTFMDSDVRPTTDPTSINSIIMSLLKSLGSWKMPYLAFLIASYAA